MEEEDKPIIMYSDTFNIVIIVAIFFFISVPSEPRNIQVQVQPGSRQGSMIVVSWDPPGEFNGFSEIILYHIRYWKSSRPDLVFQVSLSVDGNGDDLSYRIDGLDGNSTYNIQVHYNKSSKSH